MDYHPLWSLAVEEHYYIAWPAFVRKLSSRLLAGVSLAICILVPLARWEAFRHGHLLGGEWYTWFAADGLAAGSLLAVVLRSPISRVQAIAGSAILLPLAPVLLAAFAPFGILSRQRMLGGSLQLTLVNAFFAGLLLLFLLIGSGPHKQGVHSKFLQFFGFISYGLYLIHPLIFRLYDTATAKTWPALQPSPGHFNLIVLRFVVVSFIAVGLSYLSRRYYEEWFLRLKDRFAPQPARKRKTLVVPPPSASAHEPAESLTR
jgi:peptidoglycan/LPS O-acetylase OafA/YrhL